MASTDPDERLRQDAAQWFARMRGPEAARHQAAFDAWQATPQHRETYERLIQGFEASAILRNSKRAGLRTSATRRPNALPAGLKVALAACLVAAVGLAAVGLGQRQTPSSPGQQYATALGEIRTITLADGAILTLDTDSAATTQADNGRQQVRLRRGRARLTTPSHTTLALEAGDASLRTEGSTLDLALGPERQVEITVLSGAPTLAVGHGALKRLARYQPIPQRRVRLGPGEPLKALQADAASDANWPQGLRTFQKTPLARVTAEAHRYDRRKIVFDDPGVGKLEVSGVFKVTQTDRLALALAKAFGLTVRTAPGGDLVLSRQAA